MVEKGWKWSVANGKKAKIWGDPWLNDLSCPRILTPNPGDGRWTHVSDLIDGVHMVWKESVINEVFLQRDAVQILSIPLSTTGVVDKRIWKDTSDGKFSVKSAYVLAKEMVQQKRSNSAMRGQPSGESEDDGKWRRVWHAHCPMKIKLFLWRSLQNILPVNVALAQKRIHVDSLCPVCGMEEETASHMLLRCHRASKVWTLSPFRLRPEELLSTQFGEIWSRLGAISKGEDKWHALGLFATICWHVWKARNDWVFNRRWIEETGFG